MFVLAHLAIGLIIGKITENYTMALAGALLIDLDHLIPYIKHKIIYDFKKFWKTITNSNDPYGNQRNYLHSFFAFIFINSLVFLFDYRIGIAFSLGYASHLLLDMLDNSDFYPLYPLKYNVRGPIKYLSKTEFILTLFLFVVFFLI